MINILDDLNQQYVFLMLCFSLLQNTHSMVHVHVHKILGTMRFTLFIPPILSGGIYQSNNHPSFLLHCSFHYTEAAFSQALKVLGFTEQLSLCAALLTSVLCYLVDSPQKLYCDPVFR